MIGQRERRRIILGSKQILQQYIGCQPNYERQNRYLVQVEVRRGITSEEKRGQKFWTCSSQQLIEDVEVALTQHL